MSDHYFIRAEPSAWAKLQVLSDLIGIKTDYEWDSIHTMAAIIPDRETISILEHLGYELSPQYRLKADL